MTRSELQKLWDKVTYYFARKTALATKQDTINDLDEIRAGAALGATALQSYTEIDPTVPSWAKAESKPTYTASEVGALPDSTTIPDSTSDLNNDSGFITSADIPSNLSSFNNDTGFVSIPFVNLDSRRTNAHQYDVYQGNGAGISLIDGQLLLVRLSAEVTATGETMYINIDPNHHITNDRQVFYMKSSTGQSVAKVGDFPKNSQLLLRFYGASNMWIVIGSGDKPFNEDSKQDKMVTASTIPSGGALPNVCYNLGTTDSVTITLAAGESGVANVWMFTFTAQTTACSVTLPSGVTLANEYAWDMAAGRRFEVSIMDGVAAVIYSD